MLSEMKLVSQSVEAINYYYEEALDPGSLEPMKLMMTVIRLWFQCRQRRVRYIQTLTRIS